MSVLVDEIKQLKQQRDAVILAHTYQPGEVQDCADYVGDSYGLSVEATRTTASVIVFAGVRFMAETAAILNPDKPVILPERLAGCPMAEMITPAELIELKKKHPDHLVMCYVNSTAEIKALSDVCCTSSNALVIARKLPEDKGIIFVPDRHLGSWIREKTGREMVLWDGFCPTHLRITPEMIFKAKRLYPEAEVLIHPEAMHECRVLCDAVLSTGGMCTHVEKSDRSSFVIATELGLIHTLKVNNPEKTFHPVSREVICPNMKRGSLQSVRDALAGDGGEEVKVDKEVAEKALKSLERMLELSK